MELLENKMSDIEASKIRLELDDLRDKLINEFKPIEEFYINKKWYFDFRMNQINELQKQAKGLVESGIPVLNEYLKRPL